MLLLLLDGSESSKEINDVISFIKQEIKNVKINTVIDERYTEFMNICFKNNTFIKAYSPKMRHIPYRFAVINDGEIVEESKVMVGYVNVDSMANLAKVYLKCLEAKS